MRVEELRVGNWVNYLGDNMQFDEIDLSYLFNPSIDIYKTDLEPIPLTEEILLKCGFEKSAWDNYSTFRNMFCSEGCVVISLEHSCIEIGDLMLDINIKHLHQLQNLYFELTNKELEIEL